MKKSIIHTAVFAMLFLCSCESEKQIATSQLPQPVLAAFQAKYADITPDKWVTEKEKGKLVYEAQFKRDNKKVEAEFDEKGNFIREE